MMTRAGRLMKVVTPGRRRCSRQGGGQGDAKARQQRLKVAGPADGDGGRGQAVFEQQVPAYHPGGQLAQGGIAVGIDGAGHRHGGGEFRIAQGGETAGNGGHDERQRQGGAGRQRARAGEHENARADDGAYAHEDKVERPQHLGQSSRLLAVGDHVIQILGSK